jgi:hypothetical protein
VLVDKFYETVISPQKENLIYVKTDYNNPLICILKNNDFTVVTYFELILF